MVPSFIRGACVVNANVAIPPVTLFIILSAASKFKLTRITAASSLREGTASLTLFEIVWIVRPLLKEDLTTPVTSSPAANEIECEPAGRIAVADVHTKFNISADRVQPLKVAEPCDGDKTPIGLDLPVK